RIAGLQEKRQPWIMFTDRPCPCEIGIVENNDLHDGLRPSFGRGKTGVETSPIHVLPAGGRLGAQYQRIEIGKPRPGDRTLGLAGETIAFGLAKSDDRREILDRRVTSGNRYGQETPARQAPHLGPDGCGRHYRPFVAKCAIHGMRTVAPETAIVATSGADEYRWFSDQDTFALDGRPEDFRDAQCHGRYSAQV